VRSSYVTLSPGRSNNSPSQVSAAKIAGIACIRLSDFMLGLRPQTCGGDARQSAEFVIVGAVSGDAHGAHGMPVLI
jgi:hypothetical protein